MLTKPIFGYITAVVLVGSHAARLLRPAEHDAIRAKAIEAINREPSRTWKAGANPRFKGLPRGASKALCGMKPYAETTAGHLAVPHTLEAASLPPRFESEEQWPQCRELIDEVRDQSACGCCFAFASTGAAASRLCIYSAGKVAVSLSPEEVCFCTEENGCLGGFPHRAWWYIRDNGVVTGSEYMGSGPFQSLGLCSSFSLPRCHHGGNKSYPIEDSKKCPDFSLSAPTCPRTCDAHAKAPYSDFKNARYSFQGRVGYLPQGFQSIAEQLLLAGPVQAGMNVKEDFEDYVSGIYAETTPKVIGGHAVVIVGWGVANGTKSLIPYWRVQNSWSRDWGENGYFRIVRGLDESRIESSVIANSIDSVWVGPGLRVMQNHQDRTPPRH